MMMIIAIVIVPVYYDEIDDNNAGDGDNDGGSDGDKGAYYNDDHDCDNELMVEIMTLMVITIMSIIVIIIVIVIIMVVVILIIMTVKGYDGNYYDGDGVGADNYTDDDGDGIFHGSDDSDYDVFKYCGYNDGGKIKAGCAKWYLTSTATASWLFLLVAWISAVLPISSVTSMEALLVSNTLP